MRATTLHGPRDIRLEERPDPAVGAPTDAVVQVVRTCVCGSDLWDYRGVDEITQGQTIGHEAIGTVVETGAQVTGVRPGDFVVVPFCQSDNTCPHCRAGAHSACEQVAITATGQAEYALVRQAEGSLVPLPGRPDEQQLPALMALSDVMPTGWHAAVSAGVRPGHTVVVVGDGAVGLCGVLAAVQLGAARVVSLSRYAPRQRVAEEFGATHVVAERGREAGEAVKELTDGIGAEAVLECVGTDDAMRTAVAVARPGATVGFVGVPHGVALPVERMFAKNVGLAGGMAPVRRYLPDLMERVLQGRMDPGPVFDQTLPLAEVPEAYRRMDQRESIKVLLEL